MTANSNAAQLYADKLELAARSRQQTIEQLFEAETFSLTSLMGPVSGGPEWPSDAAWLAMCRSDSASIISDGLSDPWIDRDRPDTGLGLEVYMETPDVKLEAGQPLMALADSWLFPTVAEISHTLASYPRLSEKLLAGVPLAMRFNIEHIKDGRGLVGALLARVSRLAPWP